MSASLVEIRRRVHREPEIGFTEIQTAALVVTELSEVVDALELGADVCDVIGLPALPSDEELAAARDRASAAGVRDDLVVALGHGASGVVATVHGSSPGPTVAIRFDMDALPVTEP